MPHSLTEAMRRGDLEAVHCLATPATLEARNDEGFRALRWPPAPGKARWPRRCAQDGGRSSSHRRASVATGPVGPAASVRHSACAASR